MERVCTILFSAHSKLFSDTIMHEHAPPYRSTCGSVSHMQWQALNQCGPQYLGISCNMRYPRGCCSERCTIRFSLRPPFPKAVIMFIYPMIDISISPHSDVVALGEDFRPTCQCVGEIVVDGVMVSSFLVAHSLRCDEIHGFTRRSIANPTRLVLRA